eukprot:3240432-Rhodomonas_salina.2
MILLRVSQPPHILPCASSAPTRSCSLRCPPSSLRAGVSVESGAVFKVLLSRKMLAQERQRRG